MGSGGPKPLVRPDRRGRRRAGDLDWYGYRIVLVDPDRSGASSASCVDLAAIRARGASVADPMATNEELVQLVALAGQPVEVAPRAPGCS